MKDFSLISGRHAVEEALNSGHTIEKIWLARSVKGPFEQMIRMQSREKIISLSYADKSRLDRLTRSNHQGVVAQLSPLQYVDIESLIPHLIEHSGNPLVVLTDGITDVRNIGAIARTCEVLGAAALVLPTKKSALINEFAVKSSAGALLNLPVCRSHSLINATEYLIDCGFEILALDGKGEKEVTAHSSSGAPMALILGDEEMGIRKPLLQLCHHRLKIAQRGHVDSLNVSVATGIALYCLLNQSPKT